MFKRAFCVFTMLLIPCILIGCNKETKQEPIDWETLNVNSMTAIRWSLGGYDITNVNEINTIMEYIKNTDFTNKIEAFGGDEDELLGGTTNFRN